MSTLISPAPNERFFIEPQDITPESNFANTRTAEMLQDLCKFVDNEMHVFALGRPGSQKERRMYEVTFAGVLQLRKAYFRQTQKHLPLTLWTCRGNGPLRRYTPPTIRKNLQELLKRGDVATADNYRKKEPKH